MVTWSEEELRICQPCRCCIDSFMQKVALDSKAQQLLHASKVADRHTEANLRRQM